MQDAVGLMDLGADLDLQDDLLRRERDDFDTEFLIHTVAIEASRHLFVHFDSVEVRR